MARFLLMTLLATAGTSAATTRPAITVSRVLSTEKKVEPTAMTKVLALRGGVDLTPTLLCKMMTAVYGGFGVILGSVGPGLAFGPKSPVSYFTEVGDSGEFFAHALGALMTLVYSSPFWAGVDAAALAKVMLPANVYFLGLFIYCATTLPAAKDSTNAILPFNLWWTQVAIGAVMLYVNTQVV